MEAKTAIIATTRRFLTARATRRSIIEQDPALDDDALAYLQPAPDDRLFALLKARLDRARLEHPGFDLDEHAIGLVAQHQRGRRYDREPPRRREEGRVG